MRYIMIDGKPCERFEHDLLFSPDPTSWVRFSGTYRENSNKETITVQVEDHRLLLRLHDNDDGVTGGTCIPLDETRFVWSGGLIEFHSADDRIIPALTAMEVYTFWRV